MQLLLGDIFQKRTLSYNKESSTFLFLEISQNRLLLRTAMILLVRGQKRSWDGAPHMNASTATQMVDYRIRKTSISMTSPIDGSQTDHSVQLRFVTSLY